MVFLLGLDFFLLPSIDISIKNEEASSVSRKPGAVSRELRTLSLHRVVLFLGVKIASG